MLSKVDRDTTKVGDVVVYQDCCGNISRVTVIDIPKGPVEPWPVKRGEKTLLIQGGMLYAFEAKDLPEIENLEKISDEIQQHVDNADDAYRRARAAKREALDALIEAEEAQRQAQRLAFVSIQKLLCGKRERE